MITCPECAGKGKRQVYVCGRGEREIKCLTCGESGQITEEHLHRITFGVRMRRERVDIRSMTMRSEAERLACSFREWNAIEHGEEPTSAAGRQALAIRKQELSQ